MRAAAFALAVLAAAAPPANADAPDNNLAAERAAIAAFQDKDQRLQDVAWKLVRGNAPFCSEPVLSIGLQLQDTASYGRPKIAKAALDLKGAFAVQTAASGSPAASSSAFPRNREITAIAGVDINAWEAENQRDWKRLTRAHSLIDEQLERHGEVSIAFADGAQQSVAPVSVCATRFELLGASKKALADGTRVVIGVDFPAFTWTEEAVFAGVIAHELAHNLLGHREWLDRNSRKRRNVRLTEREADRLMPWLLANAGYDPQAAVSFMERWGKNHSKGFFRNRAYEGWDERAEHIADEVLIVREVMEREGKADWASHFRREIDPQQGLFDAPDR